MAKTAFMEMANIPSRAEGIEEINHAQESISKLDPLELRGA
jgi:hypothetical protein